MPLDAPIPQPLLASVAAVAIFVVMLDLGLGIVVGEFRWVWRNPRIVVRGVLSVLVVVPLIALAVTQIFDLSRATETGIALMAIAPGAPIALRRSLGAGGHVVLAPALQILVALLAVVSMPLSVAVLDEYYAGKAVIDPLQVMKEVFVAQLLPLSLGMALRRVRPAAAAWIAPRLAPFARALLLALTVAVVVDAWQPAVDAGPGAGIAIAIVTVLSLAAGHLLGGPYESARTAVAVCSAARNPGLALVVATLNRAPPAVIAAILEYLVISALLVLAYVIWRRRGRNAIAAG